VDRSDYPVAEAVFTRILTLPLHPGMSDDDVRSVVHALDRTLERVSPVRA
jgi:dTDP-4-amino-4,6-dideoxygalactose transaminase